MRTTQGCRSIWSVGRMLVMSSQELVDCGRFVGPSREKASGADRALFTFTMLLIYRKGIKDDLTQKEKSVLRKINAEW